MKRIIYITILAFLFLAGCTKPSAAPAPTPEQYDRYIFFSHSVETKATLVEKATDMNGKDFGVVGFKYDENTDWTTFSTTEVNGNLPKPNVFYDDDNTTLVDVETVGVNGTRDDNEAIIATASYTPLQGWSNSKKYAFFAFYPTPDENVTLVNLDEENTPYSGGVPAIKYTNPTFDVEKMKDVMTANCYTDLFWKSSTEGGNNIPSGEVNFEFDHKLSCLEVRVKESSAASINITDFTLTLSGVQYEGIIIPLNGDNNKLITSQSATHSISLPLISREISLGPEFQNIGDLLLIPQDDNISISLNVDYSRKYGDNTPVNANFTTSTPFTTTLIKGTKHFLQLDFGDKNVYVMQSSSGWDEKNVKHEFN